MAPDRSHPGTDPTVPEQSPGPPSGPRRGPWVAVLALAGCLLLIGLVALGAATQPERLAGEATPSTTVPTSPAETGSPDSPTDTDEPRVERPDDPESALSETVVASDGLSQVRVPGYWAETPDELRDAEAVIAIGEPLGKASVEVFSYPKEDYTSFDDYVALTEEWLRGEEFGESTIDDLGEVTTDGRPAVRYEVTASTGGVNQVMWWVMVHGEHAYYDVVGWTVPSERDQAEPVITEVMESFEEIEDEI